MYFLQNHLSLLAVLIAGFSPIVSAACGSPPGSVPQWQCNICGDNGGAGSQGIACEPRNATFDDIPTGSLSTYNAVNGSQRYKLTNWTSLNVVKPASKTTVAPFSLPNYAKSVAGKAALLFSAPSARTSELGDVYGGGIYSMRYGCALVSTGVPTSCIVNVTSLCTRFSSSSTYNYTTSLLRYLASNGNTSLAYAERFVAGLYDNGPGFPQGNCYNSSLTATAQNGQAVDLFVDEVLLFGFVKVPGSIGA